MTLPLHIVSPLLLLIKSRHEKIFQNIFESIRETQINHVRVGKDRTKFTGIWMVEVEGRIFARSYYGADRSWYTAFLNGDEGSIKCGKDIVDVKGEKPTDINTITEAINKAYEKKYLVKAYNKKWVDGLNGPERVARTMEFIPLQSLQNLSHLLVALRRTLRSKNQKPVSVRRSKTKAATKQ